MRGSVYQVRSVEAQERRHLKRLPSWSLQEQRHNPVGDKAIVSDIEIGTNV